MNGHLGKRPSLFILGAPKSGTSTLYELLRRHPDIYLPASKIEPHYFARDIALHQRHPDLKSYLSLFSEAPEGAVIGEASTWYLYSKDAVRNILEFNPDAKCIVMLRNPVDMAHSMHAFNLVKFHEDVADFGEAWSLQAERRAGRRLPAGVTDPSFVQYFDACALASPVERALSLLGPGRVQFHVFEDFLSDPAASTGRILRFLGLEPLAIGELPRVNPNRRWRQPWLARMLTRLPSATGPAYGTAKWVANRLGVRPGRMLHRLNEAPADRDPMSPVLRAELLAAFAENNDRLRRILEHPLETWRY